MTSPSLVQLALGLFLTTIGILSYVTGQTGVGRGSGVVRRREQPLAYWCIVLFYMLAGASLDFAALSSLFH
jgi:hypothetical protein